MTRKIELDEINLRKGELGQGARIKVCVTIELVQWTLSMVANTKLSPHSLKIKPDVYVTVKKLVAKCENLLNFRKFIENFSKC